MYFESTSEWWRPHVSHIICIPRFGATRVHIRIWHILMWAPWSRALAMMGLADSMVVAPRWWCNRKPMTLLLHHAMPHSGLPDLSTVTATIRLMRNTFAVAGWLSHTTTHSKFLQNCTHQIVCCKMVQCNAFRKLPKLPFRYMIIWLELFPLRVTAFCQRRRKGLFPVYSPKRDAISLRHRDRMTNWIWGRTTWIESANNRELKTFCHEQNMHCRNGEMLHRSNDDGMPETYINK